MHPAQKPERIILRLVLASLFASLLLGCQNTRELLTAEGYPAPFIDGFEAGCSSGRQATAALQAFRKDVPRYLKQPEYATGWDDGFRQCKAAMESDLQRQWHEQDHDDENWRSHVNQSMANALREHQDRP